MKQMMKVIGRRKTALVNGAIVGISAILVACGGGGSGSSSSSSTGTVRGNIAQLSAMQIEAPAGFEAESLVARLGAVAGIDAALAQSGSVSNCTVTIGGLSDTTDAGGNFVINGVPAGQRVLNVNCNGVSGNTTVAVTAGGTTNLINIIVDDGNARATTTQVTGGSSNTNTSTANTNTSTANTNTSTANTNTDDDNINDDDSSNDDDDNTNDDDDDDDDDDNSND